MQVQAIFHVLDLDGGGLAVIGFAALEKGFRGIFCCICCSFYCGFWVSLRMSL